MLQHTKLDHKFWAKGLATSRYIYNLIFIKAISSMTLEEA